MDPRIRHGGADAPAPLAIVTGASSGIGLAVATRLAGRGYRTILIARRADRLEALAARLSRHAPSFACPMDLSDARELQSGIDRVLAEHGPADVLVNNAGGGLNRPFLEQSPAMHRDIMEVHYFAAVMMIRAVLPGMLERQRGHVIGIASISTKMGPWGHAAYSASKCAVVSLMQTLAAEHADTAVRFSYVNPGVVQTEYFDHPSYAALADRLRRHWISADRVARGVESLLDRPRLELCIPRHYRVLDWIGALSPSLLHRLIRFASRPPRETGTAIDETAASLAVQSGNRRGTPGSRG